MDIKIAHGNFGEEELKLQQADAALAIKRNKNEFADIKD